MQAAMQPAMLTATLRTQAHQPSASAIVRRHPALDIDATLHQLLAARQGVPFAWGSHDCCQWALSVQRAITGLPLAVHPYSDALGAHRVLRSLGGYVGALRGLGFVPHAFARQALRGDVVLVPAGGNVSTPAQPDMAHEFGCALAIATGDHATAAGALGLVRVPMAQWISAWRHASLGGALCRQ